MKTQVHTDCGTFHAHVIENQSEEHVPNLMNHARWRNASRILSPAR